MVGWLHEAADARAAGRAEQRRRGATTRYALRDACAQLDRAAGRGAHQPDARPRGVPAHQRRQRRRHRDHHRPRRSRATALALRYLSRPAAASVDSLLMATTNDLKNGMVLTRQRPVGGERVPARQARQGRRLRAHHAKNVLTGKVVDKTFNAGTKVDVATVDKRDDDLPLQGGHRLRLHGQGHLRPALRPRADARHGQGLPAGEHGGDGRHARGRGALRRAAGQRRAASSPHTDPGLQGDRSTGGTKPATLETGAEIQVPLFLTTGEKIKVDTRDGRYLGRVNDK